jgi:signal transduction histidine kinase/CheY-like chemotaxis protein
MPGHRDDIIDAINQAIEIFSFHNEKTFDEVMTNGIRPVADAVGLDRVVFYKLTDVEGGKCLGQVYRWDKSEGGLISLAEELKVLPHIPVLENWVSTASQGNCVRIKESEYTEDAAAFMSVYGIKSILIVPIFTRGAFWGIVTFQEHTNDRYFDENCADLLHSAARIFSNAIIRQETERSVEKALAALKRREKMLGTLNRAAVIFLSRNEKEFEDTMTTGIREIADVFSLDRLSIWRHIKKPDAMHVSQIYRWDREAGGTTEPTKGLEDVTYAQLAPRWETIFSSGESINSPVNLLPEAAMLKSFGCLSAFITPIYINNAVWGFALLEDRHSERFFEDDSVEMMRSAILLCANTVISADTESKIKKALRKATEASKAKSEFLSNMSHEMRTPLNAITGMTTIGKKAKDLERKDYALDKIEVASTHLLGVINDVLDMSKIEANMLELSPIEFSFEKMLQKIATVVNYRVDEKQQKLSVHIDNAIPKTMIADDQRLAQVITNLLINAVKFTHEKGSITFDARFIGEEDGLCTLQISVKDTGIGISKEQQKRLFSSFQQAESSTTRKFGGTGLGLAISKSIVEMMGGKIWIESEIGKGAAFIFTVKMKRGKEKEQDLLVQGLDSNNVRIVAVDDDPDVLEYFMEIMQGLGLPCETAENGEKALQLAEHNGTYHIYFVDWKMPGMNGIQLTRELKKRHPENTIVIMISAFEWAAIAEEAKEAGVDKFLSKPLFPSSIADVINEYMGTGKKQPEENETNINGIFAGKRLLLVEDVEINREIVLALLEPTQLKIDCAENGMEAVNKFNEAQGKYDLIFMDIQMPEMDGYEATRRIRAIEAELRKNSSERAKKVPIVAMTANVFREDIKQCLEAGMDSHIGKPLDFDEVIKRLRNYW